VIAFAVGGIEALGLLAGKLHLTGGVWAWVVKLNDNFGLLGYCIVALFGLSWILSIAFYKWRRFDDLEFDEGDAS
jgi:high-affinity nickel-transport protein